MSATRMFVIAACVVAAMLGSSHSAKAQYIVASGCHPYYYWGGAVTAPGDILRGQGAYLYGAGAYMQGLGQYVSAVGQVEQERYRAARAYQEAERARLTELYARQREEQAARNRQAREARLRAAPSSRSRGVTPAEVATGKALNSLLKELAGRSVSFDFGDAALTAAQLTEVNVATASGLSFRLFDQEGHVHWPASLQQRAFAEGRAAVEEALVLAFEQVERNGKADVEMMDSVERRLAALRELVRSQLARTGSQRDWEAIKFVDALRQAARALSSDEAGLLLDGTLAYEPANTSDLIEHMLRHDLRFAPADQGGSSVYVALYDSLSRAREQVDAADRTVHVGLVQNGK